MTIMNMISGILRLICGLALIIFSIGTYYRASEHVAAGNPVQVLGITIGLSSGGLALALEVVGLIGVLLLVLGVVTLVKK